MSRPDLWLRIGREVVPPPMRFSDYLWQGVVAQFIAGDTHTSGLLAVCAVHSLSSHHGFAYIDVTPLSETAPAADLLSAAAQTVDHAFRHWNLRKVHSVHAEWAPSPVASLDSAKEELRLREHLRYDGHFWDEITCTISADDWAIERADYSLDAL